MLKEPKSLTSAINDAEQLLENFDNIVSGGLRFGLNKHMCMLMHLQCLIRPELRGIREIAAPLHIINNYYKHGVEASIFTDITVAVCIRNDEDLWLQVKESKSESYGCELWLRSTNN